MSPQDILAHLDQGRLWPAPISADPAFDLPAACASALQVRALRIARGEMPRGFKLGFTNRTIWPRYKVFAPIWGTVYDSTLSHCDGSGTVSLARTCQPRLEPEIVFGMKAAPGATLDDLFQAIDWVAPGFEIVQSHLTDWKFQAADTVADGALHAKLLVGRPTPVGELAGDAASLHALLTSAQVTLSRNDQPVEMGMGANVLASPLHALHQFVKTLGACPGAPALAPGDLVSTGTWTDAWPVAPGERWSARFSLPNFELSASLSD